MIVRILGEGQRAVDDGELEVLNALDSDLIAGGGGRRRGRRSTVRCRACSTRCARWARPLPDDEIVPSDLVLPSADASLDEVRELLGDEGLIPG